jgi:hypothetical protein
MLLDEIRLPTINSLIQEKLTSVPKFTALQNITQSNLVSSTISYSGSEVASSTISEFGKCKTI